MKKGTEDKHQHSHNHGHTHCHCSTNHCHCNEHHHHHSNDGFLSKLFITLGWKHDEHDHDHGDHAGHDHSDTFVPKKWILIVGTILGIIAIYHMLVGLFSNGPIIQLLDNAYIQLALGTIAFLIMGIAFIIGSTNTLRNKEISEDTLVAIATSSAFVYSVSVLIVNMVVGMHLPYFFYEMIEILWLIYIGRFIEEWLTNKVSKDISSLESLKPKLALIIRDGVELEVDSKEINIGDIVIVKAGQIVPIDGEVTEGTTTIDESALTGESMPITKKVGSQVFGGTISSSGMIMVKATKTLDESFISKIIDSVNESMSIKPKSQRMADKIAAWLIPTVLVIAFVSFFATGIIFTFVSVPNVFVNIAGTESSWIYAYYILITVLVIACPCSFAMTTPMSVLASSSTSKREGVVFSSNSLFEVIKSVDVICFDKTGTLTEGKFEVIDTDIKDDLLSEIISIEKQSNHPLAKSIVNQYNNVKTEQIKTEEVVGRGIKSSNLMIGSLTWVKENVTDFKESEETILKRKQGSAFIYVFNNKEVLGHFELRDKIKEEALMTLSQIRKMGIEVVMITGDQKETANTIAKRLGIKEDNVYSEVSPQDKSSIIMKLQKEGKVVSFVGDGINDSVALVQADIGIAMGEGSDAAIEAADIVLNKEDLSLVAYAIWLSRRTLYTIKRGFTIAIGYNAIMVPLAAFGVIGLTGAGPAIAALSMIFNDSVAMINAMTLSADDKAKFDKKFKINK